MNTTIKFGACLPRIRDADYRAAGIGRYLGGRHGRGAIAFGRETDLGREFGYKRTSSSIA